MLGVTTGPGVLTKFAADCLTQAAGILLSTGQPEGIGIGMIPVLFLEVLLIGIYVILTKCSRYRSLLPNQAEVSSYTIVNLRPLVIVQVPRVWFILGCLTNPMQSNANMLQEGKRDVLIATWTIAKRTTSAILSRCALPGRRWSCLGSNTVVPQPEPLLPVKKEDDGQGRQSSALSSTGQAAPRSAEGAEIETLAGRQVVESQALMEPYRTCLYLENGKCPADLRISSYLHWVCSLTHTSTH